jgi:hypothetical protein
MTVLLIAEPPAAAEDWAYPVHQIASWSSRAWALALPRAEVRRRSRGTGEHCRESVACCSFVDLSLSFSGLHWELVLDRRVFLWLKLLSHPLPWRRWLPEVTSTVCSVQ